MGIMSIKDTILGIAERYPLTVLFTLATLASAAEYGPYVLVGGAMFVLTGTAFDVATR